MTSSEAEEEQQKKTTKKKRCRTLRHFVLAGWKCLENCWCCFVTLEAYRCLCNALLFSVAHFSMLLSFNRSETHITKAVCFCPRLEFPILCDTTTTNHSFLFLAGYQIYGNELSLFCKCIFLQIFLASKCNINPKWTTTLPSNYILKSGLQNILVDFTRDTRHGHMALIAPSMHKCGKSTSEESGSAVA